MCTLLITILFHYSLTLYAGFSFVFSIFFPHLCLKFSFLGDLIREDKKLKNKKIPTEAVPKDAATKSKKRPADEEDEDTLVASAATATKKIKGADGAAKAAGKKEEAHVKVTFAKKEGEPVKKDTPAKGTSSQKEKKVPESGKRDEPKVKEKDDKPQSSKREVRTALPVIVLGSSLANAGYRYLARSHLSLEEGLRWKIRSLGMVLLRSLESYFLCVTSFVRRAEKSGIKTSRANRYDPSF